MAELDLTLTIQNKPPTRRFSFSSISTAFPMAPYLDQIEDWEANRASFINNINACRPNSEDELTKVSELLSKFKLSYIEFLTKAKFLEYLSVNRDREKLCLSQDLTQQLEIEQQEKREKLSDIQTHKDRIIAEISTLIDFVTQGHQKFEDEKKTLCDMLEDVKHIMEEYDVNGENNQTGSSSTQREHEKLSDIAIISKQIGGVEVTESGKEYLALRFQIVLPHNLSGRTVNMRINFQNRERLIISSVKVDMNESGFFCSDIIEEAKFTNDITFLIAEIRNRITNFLRTQYEITCIMKDLPHIEVASEQWNEVRIKGRKGQVKIVIPVDYPALSLPFETSYIDLSSSDPETRKETLRIVAQSKSLSEVVHSLSSSVH